MGKHRVLVIMITLLLSGCYDWNENMQRSRMEEIDRLAAQARERDNNPNQYNYKLLAAYIITDQEFLEN